MKERIIPTEILSVKISDIKLIREMGSDDLLDAYKVALSGGNIELANLIRSEYRLLTNKEIE